MIRYPKKIFRYLGLSMWFSNRMNRIISEVQRQKNFLMIFLTSDKVLAMLGSWIGTCLVFLHSHSSLGQCVQSPSFMNMYKARGCTMQCTSYAWVEKLQNSYFVNLRIFKVPWGSLYLGFLGVSSGGLVAETVWVLYPSLLRSALPMLLWLSSSMVLLVSSGTILRGMESRPWLFVQSSTGPK